MVGDSSQECGGSIFKELLTGLNSPTRRLDSERDREIERQRDREIALHVTRDGTPQKE